MRIDRGRLGWGVFFLTLGLVPLSIRLGWVDPAWFEGIWRLWPLILVGIGIGLILRRTAFAAIGNVIVGLTFGLIIGGALATPINAGISCIPTGGTGGGATTQTGHVHGRHGGGPRRLPLRRRRHRDYRGRRLDGGRDGRRGRRRSTSRPMPRAWRSIAPEAPPSGTRARTPIFRSTCRHRRRWGSTSTPRRAAWPPTSAARGCLS